MRETRALLSIIICCGLISQQAKAIKHAGGFFKDPLIEYVFCIPTARPLILSFLLLFLPFVSRRFRPIGAIGAYL